MGKYGVRRVLHILMVLCGAGILCCAFVLFADSREYAEGDAAYRQVRQIQEFSQGEPSQQNRRVDFESLEKINPEVVAWLISQDAEIDYPVVQGRDNDHYLRHMFTGDLNKLGSIFMDYRNSRDFSDRNTIIYGHNMKDGSMFASLAKYRNQSHYDSFPGMVLYTPKGSFMVELFAGIVVDGSHQSLRFQFADDNDFLSYLDSIREESFFKSNTVVTSDDPIITLCTCSYEFTNARYALFGKLTPVPQ